MAMWRSRRRQRRHMWSHELKVWGLTSHLSALLRAHPSAGLHRRLTCSTGSPASPCECRLVQAAQREVQVKSTAGQAARALQSQVDRLLQQRQVHRPAAHLQPSETQTVMPVNEQPMWRGQHIRVYGLQAAAIGAACMGIRALTILHTASYGQSQKCCAVLAGTAANRRCGSPVTAARQQPLCAQCHTTKSGTSSSLQRVGGSPRAQYGGAIREAPPARRWAQSPPVCPGEHTTRPAWRSVACRPSSA